MEPTFESADLLVIGVNTTRPSRHKSGAVSVAQIHRVAERLRRATSEQLRIVVTHQPVHATRREEEKSVLHGCREAVREWALSGADLVLGGHIHLPYVRPLRERFHDLPRNVWIVQAGTAVSKRVRYDVPNSVNLIRYARAQKLRQCVVERWDYDPFAKSFKLVDRTEISLDGS